MYTYRGIDDIIYHKDGFVTQVNKTHPSGVSYKLHGLLKPSGERVADEIYIEYLPSKSNTALFGFGDQQVFWGFINYQNKVALKTDGSILTPFEFKTEDEVKETLRMPLCEGIKLVMNLVDNEAIEPYQGELDFLDFTYDSYILIKGMTQEAEQNTQKKY